MAWKSLKNPPLLMQLAPLDWLLVAIYLIFSLGVGIYFKNRSGKNSEEYYLAGRTLPWWVLGTSMVATTFAADTPLAITELSRTKGLWENWFWWNSLLYGLLAVFLFSRLWRRANVLTENELLELRYSGKPAAFLRFFKAGYFALLFNFIVMGWVINGMSSVLAIMLGGDETMRETLIWSLVALATIYALLSGFWGVVITDVVQFVIAMAGSIILAIVALNHVGGVDGLMTKLDSTLLKNSTTLEQKIETQEQLLSTATPEDREATQTTLDGLNKRLDTAPQSAEEVLNVIPPLPKDVPIFSFEFLNSPFFQFLVLMVVMWWSNHSTDGGGYLIQRTMAAKNERHALAANLWYNFASLALRTWPWVIVALVSIVLFPDLSDHPSGEKAGYALVMNELLGPGLRGLLVVSFLAAFMSTIDTHLNWGSSYLVHDIYRRFFKPGKSEKHYVNASRLATLLLMLVAAYIAQHMGSIEKAWKFVMAMGSGIGLVLILRWFWWRVNAWSEISALAVSVLFTILFELLAANQTLAAGESYVLFGAEPKIAGHLFPFHLQLLVIVAASLTTWISVTFLTKPEPHAHLAKFYQRVQPGGFWKPISSTVETTLPSMARDFIPSFIAGIAFIYGGMFLIGFSIFGKTGPAIFAGLCTVLGFAYIWFFVLQENRRA